MPSDASSSNTSADGQTRRRSRTTGVRRAGITAVRSLTKFRTATQLVRRARPVVFAYADMSDEARALRAEGALLGLLAGDAFGSQCEFQPASLIRMNFPEGGPRDMDASTVWDTLAGQPTDDGEMALALARSIAANSRYAPADAARAYGEWLRSSPFDVGATIRAATTAAMRALTDRDPTSPLVNARAAANKTSQANGALMRVAPLGISMWSRSPSDIMVAAGNDCRITHPHPVCVAANMVYTVCVARAVRGDLSPKELHQLAMHVLDYEIVPKAGRGPVREAIVHAEDSLPSCEGEHQGWVLKAIQCTFHELLHAHQRREPDGDGSPFHSAFESAMVTITREGGDTDTNAAICGALLGAVYGRDAVPQRWREVLAECRPESGKKGVRRGRPPEYWPVDAAGLARKLVAAGKKV